MSTSTKSPLSAQPPWIYVLMEAHYMNQEDLPKSTHNLRGKPTKFFISAVAASNHIIAKHVELKAACNVHILNDSKVDGCAGQIGISYYIDKEGRGYALWIEAEVGGDLKGATAAELSDFADKVDGMKRMQLEG